MIVWLAFLAAAYLVRAAAKLVYLAFWLRTKGK